MRHRPARINAVAREAAAQLIDDPAGGHVIERPLDGGEQLGLACSVDHAQHEVITGRVSKFRRIAKAAVDRVRIRGECARSLGRNVPARRCLAGYKSFIEDLIALEELFDLGAEFRASFFPGLAQAPQDLRKPRPPIALLGREVGSAEEGFTLRGHEHGQRPTAALTRHLDNFLIDVVEVGALLAIDLDVDEALVHQARDGGILERFVRHHVTPVTRGVAHRQVDGLVLFSGSSKRFFSPWIPINRVLGVLLKIGGGLNGQPIRH